MKRLLYILLGLLGFGLQGCVTAEYGTPHVSFRVKARVVNEAGEPIQGIEVRTEKGARFEYSTGFSDYQGYIDAYCGFLFPGDQYHDLHFIDVDGEANGGEYETLVVDSKNINQIEEGSGHWYEGSYIAEVGTVTLKLKAEASDTESDNTNKEEEVENEE